jgi:subfamily B ATP-binding cassette protein MsbA
MRDLLRVLGLAKRYGWWLLLGLVSMVMVSAATVFTLNLVRPIYDQLLSPESAVVTVPAPPPVGFVGALDAVVTSAEAGLRKWAGENRMALLVLALIAIMVKNAFAFAARTASAVFGLAAVRDLRAALYDSLIEQSPAYFHSRPTPELVSRATNDLHLIREVLAERMGDVVQDLLTVPVLLVYLFSLDLRLTLVAVVAVPLLFAPTVHFSRRLRVRTRQAQEREAEVATILDESVRGIRVVQGFGMAGWISDVFRRANHNQYLARLGVRAIQAANAPVMEVVGAVAALALIAWAAAQIARGNMTLGDFSAFVLCAYATYSPLKRINKFNLATQQAAVSAKRVFEIIDAPVSVSNRPGARLLTDIGDGIRFVGVGFAHDRDRWVLRGFDLEVRPGVTMALVGASGVGKSTVAQLLPRFADVLEGTVLVGGQDLRELELASLRAHIGLVTQETLLFNDSVRTNLVCGREGVSDAELEAAVRAAGADDLVRDLPAGLDTVIGEAGVRLSGGQRQRLAIARAVLADPSILVLDEATSALDPESELRIQEALDRLAPRRTTVVIAHRLATVRRADIIAVLAEGRVVELGSHDELFAANGLYRRMVDAQELT